MQGPSAGQNRVQARTLWESLPAGLPVLQPFLPPFSCNQPVTKSFPFLLGNVLQSCLSSLPAATTLAGPCPCVLDTAMAPRPSPRLYTELLLPSTEMLIVKLCFTPLLHTRLQGCPGSVCLSELSAGQLRSSTTWLRTSPNDTLLLLRQPTC